MSPRDPDDDLTGSHPSARAGAKPPEPRPAPSRLPLSATFPVEAEPADTVRYGPDIADERQLRLLGTIEGKRILELGVGNGANAVWLARQGAKVFAVDPSAERLERARALAERHEVRVELHQGDLGDTAFLRADTIDVVLSVYALAGVADPDRIFRQAHRVLRRESPVVVSVPHPAFALVDASSPEPTRIARSWFDRTPQPWQREREEGVEHRRSFGELVGGLHRAGFHLEAALEPEPTGPPHSAWWHDVLRKVPATLILRARKLGI